MGPLMSLFTRFGPSIMKAARGGFKYLGAASTAGKKGLRPIKRGVQKVMQTGSSPAGKTTPKSKNLVTGKGGVSSVNVSGRIGKGGQMRTEGGGSTFVSKSDLSRLQKTGSRVQVARNVALGVGTGQVAVAGYQKKSAKDKKMTAEVLAERESKPLVKDAPPPESSSSKPKQAITNLKGAKTHFNKWFHKKYAEVGEGATADYTDPITGETRPILMTHGKGKSQPGTAKKPSQPKSKAGTDFFGTEKDDTAGTDFYGKPEKGKHQRTNVAGNFVPSPSQGERFFPRGATKAVSETMSGPETGQYAFHPKDRDWTEGIGERGDRLGYITEAESQKKKEHSQALKRILGLRLKKHQAKRTGRFFGGL